MIYDLRDALDDQLAHGHPDEFVCPIHATPLTLGVCDDCPTEPVDDSDEIGERWACAKTTIIRSARAGIVTLSSYDGPRAWQGRVWLSRGIFGGKA